MEPKFTSLGSSINVPSVRELANGPLATIPDRYMRSDQEPLIMDNSSSSHDIPVINLQCLLAGDSNDPELHKLHSACKEWGFFQLTDHGVSSTLTNNVKLEIKKLFDLSMEEKKKFWQEPGDLQGFGQLFVVSDEQKLDWADLFYMMVLPTQMRKQDLFSKLPSSFRDTMVSYSTKVKNIVMKLLGQMERALNLTRPEELRSLFGGGLQAMRMNYYPPCPRPDLVMGLTPHSDAGGLTILLQLNDMEGLQIKKDGTWVPVKPLPNAFVVNIGDSLEIATNGIYKSIEHRAVVNSEKERLSIATFHSPNMDGMLRPSPNLVTPETPALFKEVAVADYYRRFLSNKLQEKTNLDYLRIQSGEEGDR